MTYPDLSALADFPGWKAARSVRASGPGPDAETLRVAYLDLLKLSLCDLAGASTISVGKWPDGSVSSRELRGETLRLRAAGMDWPQQGLTMVGLNRLDDLQACVEPVVRDGVPGDLIETGTWRGGASLLMRATLDSLGAGDRTVVLADSFQGFPAGRRPGSPQRDRLPGGAAVRGRGGFARLGLEAGVRFVPGFFEETLPGLAGGQWSVVRLDGDTYEATWLALESLYPPLAPGGHLIVDDYRVVPECARAVDAFRERARHPGAAARRRLDLRPLAARGRFADRRRPARGTAATGEPAADARAARAAHVPTEQEVELQRELAAVRAELERVRSERADPGGRLRRKPR